MGIEKTLDELTRSELIGNMIDVLSERAETTKQLCVLLRRAQTAKALCCIKDEYAALIPCTNICGPIPLKD